MNYRTQKKEKRLNIKHWLMRAYKIDQQIMNKIEQIKEWQALAERTTTCTSTMPKGNQTTNQIEDYAIKIILSQKAIEQEMEKLINTKREIESLISQIDNPVYRIILEQRYLLGKHWSEIAELLNYTEEHTKRNLHAEALQHAEKALH